MPHESRTAQAGHRDRRRGADRQRYSSLAAFETFLKNAITAVQSNRKEWLSTAILISWDESGGYYDSGYIEPVSFFGDGPRVPLIVVSPWVRRGVVDLRAAQPPGHR